MEPRHAKTMYRGLLPQAAISARVQSFEAALVVFDSSAWVSGEQWSDSIKCIAASLALKIDHSHAASEFPSNAARLCCQT